MINLPVTPFRPAMKPKVYSLLTFIFFTAICVVTHCLVFIKANMMVDSDQAFQWLGVSDFSAGRFFEPRFYGQDYNTFMEAFVAVPFYKLGMPVYYALPLATHLLFVTPVYFTAIYLYASGRRLNALVVLSIFLCLTPAFDVLTSIPRGFVTGFFFTTFFVLSFVNPSKLRYIYLNGIMLCIGFFINPNIAIAGAPLLVFIFLHNYKRPALYLALFVCLLSFVPLYFFFDRFYDVHPDYVVYGLIHSFSINYFIENIKNLDQVFGHINFFSENKCWQLLLVFGFLGSIIFVNDKKLFVAYLIFLLVILASFFAGKTREGSVWPYYSYGRMYIAIPMVLALCIARLPMRSLTMVTLIVLITFTFSFFKLNGMEERLSRHTDHRRAVGVRIEPLPVILDGMRVYKKFCDDNQAPHMVISTIFWLSPYIAYGGQAIYPDFPSTEQTVAERRFWVRELKRDTVYDRFIVVSINSEFDKIVEGKYPFEVERKDDFGAFLIKNNKLRNHEFLDVLRDIED